MTGNPKTSKWYAVPRAERKKKKLEITLSDEARAKLEAMAARRKISRSMVIQLLILGEKK